MQQLLLRPIPSLFCFSAFTELKKYREGRKSSAEGMLTEMNFTEEEDTPKDDHAFETWTTKMFHDLQLEDSKYDSGISSCYLAPSL